jgi:hypothetical protein
MDKLMNFAIMNKDDEPMRLRVTYDILNATNRYKEFRPCIKRYLTSHIVSKIMTVKCRMSGRQHSFCQLISLRRHCIKSV